MYASFFETESLTSSVFFAAAASLSFSCSFFASSSKASASMSHFGRTASFYDLVVSSFPPHPMSHFGRTALFSITLSIGSLASTSPLGRTAIRPLTSSVTCDVLGFFTCSLVSLRFRFFLIGTAFFSFSFCFGFCLSAVFSLLCFRSVLRLQLCFDLFYISCIFFFFERRFFFSDFFVRLFSDVLLRCSELVFVCFMVAIFFWCIDHECSHDTSLVAAHVDHVIGFGIFVVFTRSRCSRFASWFLWEICKSFVFQASFCISC